MKFLVATVVASAILTGSAGAQQIGNIKSRGLSAPEQAKADRAEKAREAAIEKDYNDTMKRIGSRRPAPKSDPWAIVRPANSADAKR